MSSLGQTVRAVLARDPAGPAIRYAGHWTTWGELAGITDGLERELARLGLGTGAQVGCILRNQPLPCAAMLGIVALDACVVTFNGLLPDDKLADDIRSANAPVVIATAEEWGRPPLVEAARAIGAAGLSLTGDPAGPVEPVPGLEAVGPGEHAPPQPDIAILMLTSGTTEFAGGVASWSLRAFRQYWITKRGAVGRIHHGVEARIVDAETGAALPFGAEGLLELKGFQVGDGESWVRTTDRGVLDADRFLWIRGRADNAINRGGFKVHPDEVAAVLEQHPAVREASVVGLPDRRLGQVPAAALVLRSGAARPSDAELAGWVRRRLMAYCVPVAFKIVDELPRTPSMKVATPAVRELFGA